MQHVEILAGKSVCKISREQLNLILDLAIKDIRCGIYAIEKDEVYHLMNERYEDTESLMAAVDTYRQEGYKVYYNSK